MVKLSEILEFEKSRGVEDMCNVHLWREGGFYRAYNWSAWLVVSFCQQEGSGQSVRPLAVSRKKMKDTDETFCFVGFPLKSLQKFIPGATGFVPVDDVHISIPVSLPAEVMGKDYEELCKDYRLWAESLPISEDKPRKPAGSGMDSHVLQPGSILQLMSRVLSYPLERKTPMENTEFISQLKQGLSMLIS